MPISFYLNTDNIEYLQPFLVICLGLLIGRIRFKGISLGVVAVLMVGLLAGYLGFTISPIFKRLGTAFFVYAIGIESGTSFLQSLKDNGFSFFLFVFIQLTFIVVLVLLSSVILKLSPNFMFGILSGTLSSTLGLLTASQITSDSNDLFIAYGITLPLIF